MPHQASSSEVLASGWWENGLGSSGETEELGEACVHVGCVCVFTLVSPQ